MERVIVEKLGQESYNGTMYEKKRILLMNDKKEDIMAKAHSYYSKDEKKQAKLNYKRNK